MAGLSNIEPKLQKLLAELVMMRLFDDFQEALSGVAFRLACGATYADGTAPSLLVAPAASVAAAGDLFATHGRPKLRHPKWSKYTYISETTKFVISGSDPFIAACSANSLVISEMQAVRNRIAHNNLSSRTAYRVVLKRHYGSVLNHVTPGLFLLSPRFTPQKLSNYIQACRIIVKDCSRH